MNSGFGLIPRLGFFVLGGLTSVLLFTSKASRESRLVELLSAVLALIAIASLVTALTNLNGSRLLRAVLKERRAVETFEIDRVDGNESDLRVLGLAGAGLERRFVIVCGTDGLEFWTDQDGRPSVVAPWSEIQQVSIVSMPSSAGLMQPSIQVVEVVIKAGPESVNLDLRPHGFLSRRSEVARLRQAFASRATSAIP